MIEILSGILSEDVYNEIDSFISLNEPHSFFHTSLIYKILNNTKGCLPYYLIHRDNGTINGVALVNVMDRTGLDLWVKEP